MHNLKISDTEFILQFMHSNRKIMCDHNHAQNKHLFKQLELIFY